MRKFQLVGVALIAVFACGMLTATSASAVTFLLAEWLEGSPGTPVTATLLADGESGPSGLLFEETVLGIKIDIVCSGFGDGTIGANSQGEITSILSLTEAEISGNPLVEPGLVCTNGANCPEPLVWADNLPWKTEVELMEDGTETFFVALTTNSGKNIGYHFDCMNGTSDLCTTPELITKLTNEANGTVDAEGSESFTELSGLKLASCELAGVEKGILEGLGFILVPGVTLGVSSGA